jgi:hypothetical protein
MAKKGPPWDLSNCAVYRQFVCPEEKSCDFKHFDQDIFRQHMTEKHAILETQSQTQINIKKELDDANEDVISDDDPLDPDNHPDSEEASEESDEEYRPRVSKRRRKSASNEGRQISAVKINKSAVKTNIIKANPKIVIKKDTINFGGNVTVNCLYCKSSFNTIDDLKNHVKDEHSDEKTALAAETKEENLDEDDDDDDDDDGGGLNDDDDEEYTPLVTPNKKPKNNLASKSKIKNHSMEVRCGKCEATYNSVIELKKHMQNEHGIKQEPIEIKTGAKKRGLFEPPKSNITKLRCGHCHLDYRSYFYLKNHHERDHVDLPLKFTKRTVKVLNELTGEESLIREIDGEESTFKCDYCEYVTTHQDLRGMHMQKEHNDTTKLIWFKCTQCPFKCRQKRTIQKHKEAHKKGTIKPHQNVFKFLPPAAVDQIRFNLTDQSPFPAEVDRKITPTIVMLQCMLCDDDHEFRNFHYVKVHFEKHHPGKEFKFKKKVIKGNDGLEDAVVANGEEDISQSEAYNCDYCEYVTHMADLRGLHMEKEHNDSSKLVYVKCDKCEYTTKSRGNLVNHKRIVHENYRPKQCEQCDKRFATKSVLDDHMMRAHSEHEILCNDCGKMFASPSMLRRHELWHHLPDKSGGPIPCNVCGKISIHKFALQKHINRVHRKLDKLEVTCQICGKSYAERRTLKQHLTKVHNLMT